MKEENQEKLAERVRTLELILESVREWASDSLAKINALEKYLNIRIEKDWKVKKEKRWWQFWRN